MTNRKDNSDEKKQLSYLKTMYPINEVRKRSALYLIDGKIYTGKKKAKLAHPSVFDPLDIDVSMTDSGYQIVWSLKENQGEGGTQTGSFRRIVQFIQEAPMIDSPDKVIVAVIVGGTLWSSKINECFNYDPPFGIGKQFTRAELLISLVQNKKCIVFDDNNMPKSNFYNTYIKGTQYE